MLRGLERWLQSGSNQEDVVVNEHQEQKKSNLKVALTLAAIALMISLWPVYVFKQFVN